MSTKLNFLAGFILGDGLPVILVSACILAMVIVYVITGLKK